VTKAPSKEMAKYIDPLAKIYAKQNNIDSFDTASISKELNAAIEFDKTYRNVDDTKKKAITTSATYEDFENRVKCAEDGLQPISSKDLQNIAHSERRRNRAIGGSVGGGSRRRARSKKGQETIFEIKTPTTAPKNGTEFDRNWKRHCPDPEAKWK
jgi:hypothetical protein